MKIMRSLIILGLSLIGFQAVANSSNVPDTTLNIVDKAKVQTWMADGRHKMFEHDWRGALATFKEVLAVDKRNGKAEYRVAECQYELMVYKFAYEHLERAEKYSGHDVDKEFYYTKGKILQKLGKLDEAITALENFIEIQGDEEKNEDQFMSRKMINDCKYAKKQIQNPLMVDVNGAGDGVNSRFREYGPVPSPDGKSLYFTSRRQDTYGGNVAGDQVYYSDIYVSKWDEANSKWGEADNVEGKANTEFFDAISDIHQTEAGELIIYATYNVEGWTKSSDIGYSKLSSSGVWSKPKLEAKRKGKKGGINTTFFESSACLTADGNTMYFVGEGFKGEGQGDIYVVKKDGRKWGVPVNLGKTINTKFDENSVSVTPDGKHIFFSTDGRLGMGGYDVYMSTKTETGWTEPKNLGYPINSLNNDVHFRLGPDGKKAYLTSARNDGRGLYDIYIVDLKDVDLFK